MAFRIVVALFVALRAVLVYGEATQLTTRPVRLPRLRTSAHAPLAPAADAAGPLPGV